MAIPTHFCVREVHYFFCAAAVEEVRGCMRNLEETLHGTPVFKVASAVIHFGSPTGKHNSPRTSG